MEPTDTASSEQSEPRPEPVVPPPSGEGHAPAPAASASPHGEPTGETSIAGGDQVDEGPGPSATEAPEPSNAPVTGAATPAETAPRVEPVADAAAPAETAVSDEPPAGAATPGDAAPSATEITGQAAEPADAVPPREATPTPPATPPTETEADIEAATEPARVPATDDGPAPAEAPGPVDDGVVAATLDERGAAPSSSTPPAPDEAPSPPSAGAAPEPVAAAASTPAEARPAPAEPGAAGANAAPTVVPAAAADAMPAVPATAPTPTGAAAAASPSGAEPARPLPGAPTAEAPAPAPAATEPVGAVSAASSSTAASDAGLASGQLVVGTVDKVDAAEVVVSLAGDVVGVIGKRHLTPNGQTDPTELLSVGDQVEAAVLVRDDPKGRVVLSRAWALKQRAWEKVEAARKANRPLTGTVTGQVKGGLVVDVGTRAFLPASHVDLHHVDDLAPLVGQSIDALVVEADKANDKVVLSRRNLLRQAERAKAAQFAATLEPGQVHRGRVALLTDFGAFVDIAGVRGLVHLSELTWGRVERAADVVSVGTEVDVKILAIKPGKKVSLSIRALTTDPLASINEGDIVQGVVTRLADFGAFVRVGDGAEGLVHVTELAEYRVHAPEEVVAPGDEVWVKVLRIDRKRRRVDLSVNQALLG